MAKREELVRRVVEEIQSGLHGETGDAFMSVRDFASRYGTSLVTAQKVVSSLKSLGVLNGAAGRTSTVRRSVPAAAAGSQQLGMIVASYLGGFFSRLIYEVREAASEKGYSVLTDSTEHKIDRERKCVEEFLKIGVAGLIVTPGLGEESASLYRELIDRGVALVLVGREVEGVNVDCITADNFAGGAAVARHFIEMGYESFGYMRFGPRLKMDMRLNGFRSTLCGEGFDLPAADIVDDNGWDVAHGYRCMVKLASRPKLPRAIMAFNDLPAIGALQYCQEHGVAVPGDVAIAGFDNLAQTEVTQPALTTVEYPHTEMAQLTIQTLLDRVRYKGERIGGCRRLRPRLVVRASSDPNAEESPVLTPQRGVYAG